MKLARSKSTKTGSETHTKLAVMAGSGRPGEGFGETARLMAELGGPIRSKRLALLGPPPVQRPIPCHLASRTPASSVHLHTSDAANAARTRRAAPSTLRGTFGEACAYTLQRVRSAVRPRSFTDGIL
jgi:hypothetical protein